MAFGQPPGGGGFGQPPGSGGFGPPPGSSPGAFGPPPGSSPGAPFGQPPGGAFGPPMGGPPPQGASGLAIAALVMACLSFVCGGFFLSIPAAIMAKVELGKIARGESSQAGETLSKAAFWVSIGNIALYVAIFCLYAVIFMMAIAGSASQGSYGGY